MEPYKKAIDLGALIRHAINWTWAEGFTKSNADLFIAWLDENKFEHRGIYKDEEGYAIRFR
jgi:hypothetical protein